ncbi:MAG: hypothetical protein ABEK50_15705 [bacterium]
MSELRLAWQSEHARKKAIASQGQQAKQYKDRPIREPDWNRKKNHPIPGLAHYNVPDDDP